MGLLFVVDVTVDLLCWLYLYLLCLNDLGCVDCFIVKLLHDFALWDFGCFDLLIV